MAACEQPSYKYTETHLRFDFSLRLAEETICPLIQFTCRRLIYLNVTILVGPHLFAYILIYNKTTERQEEAEGMSVSWQQQRQKN